jgi:hypothetical protein
MNCFLRRVAVASLLLSLFAFFVPAAQASPRTSSGSVLRLEGGWIQAMIAWFRGTPPAGADDALHAMTSADGTTTTTSSGGIGPLTGSCLDPSGGKWCPGT